MSHMENLPDPFKRKIAADAHKLAILRQPVVDMELGRAALKKSRDAFIACAKWQGSSKTTA